MIFLQEPDLIRIIQTNRVHRSMWALAVFGVVAIFIGMVCSPDRPYCVAGMSYIEKQTGCDRTVVFRATRKLKAAQLLEIESKARAGNIYIFKWPYS